MEKTSRLDEIFFQVAFLCFILFLMIHSFSPEGAYVAFAYEDGPIENAEAIFLFLAAYFCIKIFLLHRKFFGRLDIVLLLLGALYFVMGTEEISWGQRIVGLKPALLENELNNQREWNLHNLNLVEVWVYPAIYSFIFIFNCVLPVLTYFSGAVKRLCLKFGIPLMPPLICVSFWLSVIIVILIPWLRYGADGLTGAMNHLKQLRELIFDANILAYILAEYFYLIKYKKSYGA